MASETPAGIPAMEFIENVEGWLKKNEKTVDQVVQEFQEVFSKYKFMEMRFVQNKKVLKDKLPQIKSALEAVEFLMSKADSEDDIVTNFELADAILAKAKVPKTGKVCLWLGANVMLEYPIEEAKDLLSHNLKTAQESIEKLDREIDFLRDQITTTEVNMARVFNYDVRHRRTTSKRE